MASSTPAADELRVLLRAPPPAASSTCHPAAAAHAALQSLRDAGDPSYLFLRAALDLTPAAGGGEEELLFHCASGLRCALLRRWDELAPEFRDCARDWALCAGLGLPPTADGGGGGDAGGAWVAPPRTASMALLGLAAGAWKRGWDDGEAAAAGVAAAAGGAGGVDAEAQGHLVRMMLASGAVRRFGGPGDLFRALEALIVRPLDGGGDGSLETAARAASFLSALLGEFSGTGAGGFGGYRMPLEFHSRVRSRFESSFCSSSSTASSSTCSSGAASASALDEVMRIGMKALGGVVRIWTEGGDARARGPATVELSTAVVSLNCDVLGWEFGRSGRGAWDPLGAGGGGRSALVRPPERWRDVLIRPDFLGAVFAVYGGVRMQPQQQQQRRRRPPGMERLAHGVRQLLLLLSSVMGNVFSDPTQRLAYASFLVDGCLAALSRLHAENQSRDDGSAAAAARDDDDDDEAVGAETVDLCSMIARLAANFRVRGLSALPSFPTLLVAVSAVGADLLRRSAAECERAGGDPDAWADACGWRDEALGQLLEASVLLADDPWLLGGGGGTAPSASAAESESAEREAARGASAALARGLAPLYASYVTARTGMARMEEGFLFAQARELDEVREEISSSAAEEEMIAASSLGRLDVPSAAACLGSLLGLCLPRLQALVAADSSPADMTPDAAALLEETRLLVACAAHVLTDECEGETPSAPEAVVRACAADASTASAVAALIQHLMGLAEMQASAVAARPSDPRLSPLLARTLLWFFRRWAPAYVLPQPSEYGGGGGGGFGGILAAWAAPEAAFHAVAFCATLCLHYHCHWPQENQVQEEAAALLLSLARRGKPFHDLLVRAPSFQQIAALHSVTAGLRHSAAEEEVRSAIAAAGTTAPPPDAARGYMRLPYSDRANILTALLVGASEPGDAAARAAVEGCLRAVRVPLEHLTEALESGRVEPDDPNAREMARLCVDLHGGAARASEMAEPERIPRFVTPSLPRLSGLMAHYADDLTVRGRLLGLFRDYAEQFVALLDREQCLALFRSSEGLLRAYSARHCAAPSRVAGRSASALEADLEEENSYGDVLCAIQLLIHLGAKDFLDACGAPSDGTCGGGVDSGQITDVIFFGLSQILPLMTSGLLQFPNLCVQYFSLVGFMMDAYPEKACALPHDLFRPLLDSLLFGMSHSDPSVSRSSLRGVAGLAREHLRARSLDVHLSASPDVLDVCSRRLLTEVIFRPVVWDRLEPAGAALLPLAAADAARFAAVVSADVEPLFGADGAGRARVRAAFDRLMRPEALAGATSGGYEGRMNRLRFKRDFEVFVKDVHSFLIIH